MPQEIVSTTDSTEQVQAALGNKVDDVQDKEITPASEEILDEKAEASGPSEEDDSKDESEESDEEKSEARPKKKGGYKKRIDKLTKRLSEKDSEAQYWRNEALKYQKPQVEETKAEVKADTSKKPKADDFDSHELYIEAITDWKVDQRERAREAKQKESEVKSHFERQRDSYVEKAKAFQKEHEDFNDVMEEVDDIPMSLTVQEVLLNADNGPELAYELAKNKEEYKRICALSPIAAARELGKFEARLLKESEKEKAETKTTKAPKPLTPIGSKSVSKKSPDEMGFEEYKRWRMSNG